MALSLRLRLFAIILLPLLLIAVAVMLWRAEDARRAAADLQDRTLMFTALAVARDVSLGQGDILSTETQSLLADAAGGPLRYHVHAPDGVFVIGYAVPPIPISRRLPPDSTFAYFDARDRGRDVRVLRLRDEVEFDGVQGTFTITVWQGEAVRGAIMRGLLLRALGIVGVLVGAVALLLWFGVRYGLKPLTDLEDAISARSPTDLSPIRRPVPEEARGLVTRLNRLFEQVSATMDAQATFVADAAHQLRNPLAGIQALAGSVASAKTLADAQSRALDLAEATRRASDLGLRLLTLEQASTSRAAEPIDLTSLVAEVTAETRARAGTLRLTEDLAEGAVIAGDPIMLREACLNILDNALVHGGPGLSEIHVTLTRVDDTIALRIADDGQGVPPEALTSITARFSQARPGPGSGLGLSIAEAVVRQADGTLSAASDRGLSVTLTFPAHGGTDAPREAPR